MVRKMEEPANGNRIIFAKIGFLIALIVTAVLAHQYSSLLFKPSKSLPTKSQRNVLGASSMKDLQQNIGASIVSVGSQGDKIRTQIQDQVAKLLNEKKSEIEASVSSALYDAAIKPVITQFNGLPDKQKEEVKQAICK